jgi:hypothetical protein
MPHLVSSKTVEDKAEWEMQALEHDPCPGSFVLSNSQLICGGARSLRARRTLFKLVRALRAFCIHANSNVEHWKRANALIKMHMENTSSQLRKWNACAAGVLARGACPTLRDCTTRRMRGSWSPPSPRSVLTTLSGTMQQPTDYH